MALAEIRSGANKVKIEPYDDTKHQKRLENEQFLCRDTSRGCL